MMTTLKYIIYNSKCLSPAFEEVDLDICREARSFNSEHDITGFLFRSAGYYYQYVEGPHEAVDNLIASIAKDKRHSDFYVLQSGETKNRRFKDWCMGYAHAVEEDLKSVLLPSSSGEEITSAMTTAATQQETVEKT